ncbi:glycerophosphoryl diester phosphodiesterase [Methylorubrum rhodinum]|uniref:Glycerophosphoryl diester phosphodiesterase n=1 Tax=Methylorubrum rhodinum TaxID=29428 RepID=A0A840ZMG3_9HYPH|nr:glycerophosphodiester phosphodiesterase family protein [Methylorubrum rhodinum]MBB5759362.1 glycerophosphoryl diester phosphodiesterase [Methylorubrum rhodinum]
MSRPLNAPAWLTARPIAHRGLHDRAGGIPENTLAAAEAAALAGYAIECDVQISADGEAMVFHDATLGRLTGTEGAVDATPAAELGKLTVFGTAERIPTLTEFLTHIGGRVPVVVEIKSRFDGDRRLTRRTAEVVAGFDAPIALKSFDPGIVGTLAEIAPEKIPRGIVAEASQDDPEYDRLTPSLRTALSGLLHLDESRPDFLSWRVGDLPGPVPYLCRRLGNMPVMTWTVRTPEQRALAAAHADQMVFEGFRP